MQQYTLSNGTRKTRFVGELIGHATSRGNTVDRDALRWTDVDIYRTQAGKYVLHKIGRSRVYCRPDDASETSYRAYGPKLLINSEALARDLAPCPVCKPGALAHAGWIYVESDRGTTFVSDTAAGVVESAYTRDSDGVRFMNKTAQAALDDAAKNDAAITDAWLVENVA